MSYDALLINTCDLIKQTLDKWNRATEVVVAAAEPCRFEFGHRIARGPGGEDIVCTATVFFKTGTTMKENYKIRYSGREYDVVDIQRPQDSAAEHHVEVLVK